MDETCHASYCAQSRTFTLLPGDKTECGRQYGGRHYGGMREVEADAGVDLQLRCGTMPGSAVLGCREVRYGRAGAGAGAAAAA